MCTLEKQERIQTLISRLSGSAGSLETEAEDLDLSDTDDEVTTAVDEAIFCCTQCSWWCEIDEESSEEIGHDEWVCADCAYMIKQEQGD